MKASHPSMIVAFVLASAATASAQTIDLETLERATLGERPEIRAGEAALRAAESGVDAARAEMRPTLYLDAAVTGAPGLRVEALPTASGDLYVSGTRALDQTNALQPFFRYALGLRFDGPVYDFGRTAARVDAARAQSDAAAAEVDVEQEELLRATRAAFVAWLGAYEQRRIVEASLAIAVTRADQIDAAVGAGARPGSDREVAAYEVARLRVQLARARAEETDRRAVVAHASGMTLGEDVTPDPTWLEPAAPDTPLPPPAALAALELQREAIGASLRAYRRRYNPVLGVSVRLGVSAQEAGTTLTFFPAYSIQVGLSMPLWDSRIGPHVRREAEARDAALAEQEAALRLEVESENARARVAFERANEQVELAAEAVRLAESIATNAEERYRATGGSIDVVVSARQREVAARADLLTSQIDLAAARMRLRPTR